MLLLFFLMINTVYVQRAGDLCVLEGLAVPVRGQVLAAGGVHRRCAARDGAPARATGSPFCRGNF